MLARMHRHIHATREGHRAVSVPQRRTRHMDRRQRRGTSGIDRHAGTVQVEKMRDPVGDIPIGRVGCDQIAARGLLRPEQLVVAIHHADKDAGQSLCWIGLAAEQGVPGQSGVLHRCPSNFQKLAGLGVEGIRLAR